MKTGKNDVANTNFVLREPNHGLKSQIESIGVNPTGDGRSDQTFLKSLCGRVKGVWANFLCSMSKSLRHKVLSILKSIVGQPLKYEGFDCR
jgi:hypothetical protein